MPPRATCAHLSERFGSLYLAAAAYNAGAGQGVAQPGQLAVGRCGVDPAAVADTLIQPDVADSAADEESRVDADRTHRRRAGEAIGGQH